MGSFINYVDKLGVRRGETYIHIRGTVTQLCTLKAGGHILRLRSSSKLLWELLKSPLNVHTREVTSDLFKGLYRG